MNNLLRILPPRCPKGTRRVICRPKARLLFGVAIFFTATSVVLLMDKLETPKDAAIEGILALIFGGLAFITASVALVFRLTEQPREIFVKRWDWSEPPVIHLRTSK